MSENEAGVRLRELRLAAGLSQPALAAKAGVSPASISAIERYGYAPTMPVQARLARALKVKVGDIWAPAERAVPA